MRKRTVIVGATAAGLLALAGVTWFVIQHRPASGDKLQSTEQPAGQPDGLPAEDEAALRAVVAGHELATANWASGGDPYDPTKSFRVLCVPSASREIYARRPVETLRSLRRIVESGGAADAHTAVAYAHALVGYADDDPVPLLCAWSYAYYPTAKEFDDVNPALHETYRQLALKEIDERIAEVKKKQLERAPTRK